MLRLRRAWTLGAAYTVNIQPMIVTVLQDGLAKSAQPQMATAGR